MTWVVDELDGLDLRVNCAGLLRGYAVSSPQAVTHGVEDVDVNLTGSLRMTLLALPLLEASRESGVVFLSSAVALAAVPGYAVYAATKAAVHSFARSLRAELAGTPIRVFEVMPPVVDTGPVGAIDVPKVSPVTVAEATVDGLRRDRHEIRIGPVRQLAPLARIAPRLADRLVQQALGARG